MIPQVSSKIYCRKKPDGYGSEEVEGWRDFLSYSFTLPLLPTDSLPSLCAGFAVANF